MTVDSKHLRKSTQGSRTIAYPLGGYAIVTLITRTIHLSPEGQCYQALQMKEPARGKIYFIPSYQQTMFMATTAANQVFGI